MQKQLFIVPPSFCPAHLLDMMQLKFKKKGYKVTVITYMPASNSGSLQKRANEVLEQIPKETIDADIIGISSGGVIAHLLTGMCPPATFKKVMLYGTPMLCQSLLWPVWRTFWHYLTRGHLFKALKGQGVGYMTEEEAVKFLFGGFYNSLASEVAKVGESWGIIMQMIFAKLPPNTNQHIKYIVVGVDGEKFHHWWGARRWAKRSVNTTHVQLSGTHFGALLDSNTLDMLVDLLN